MEIGLKASSWCQRRVGVAEGSMDVTAWLGVEVQGKAKGVGAHRGQGRVKAWHSCGLVVAL